MLPTATCISVKEIKLDGGLYREMMRGVVLSRKLRYQPTRQSSPLKSMPMPGVLGSFQC